MSREAKARLAQSFSLDDLGFFRKVPAAPDRAVANIGLGIFLRGRPIRVRFVLKGGVAGTIAGVPAVDSQIVGADRDGHARILAWQFRRFATYACHMRR